MKTTNEACSCAWRSAPIGSTIVDGIFQSHELHC